MTTSIFEEVRKRLDLQKNNIHQFEVDNINYVVDGNSLHSYEVNDIISDFLALPFKPSTNNKYETLQKKYDGDYIIKAYEKLLELQEKGVFVYSNDIKPKEKYERKRYKLSLDISHSCNLGCVYCYSKVDKGQDIKPFMDFSLAKRAVDFLIDEYGKDGEQYEINMVGGGEPLLNFRLIKQIKDYCDIKRKESGKNIFFWVFTNGTIENQEIISWLIKEKQGITVSLDGPREVHDELRPFPNGNGSFEKITAFLGNFPESYNFWVSSVISAKNLDLIGIVKTLVELNISNAQIRPIRTNNPDLEFTPENIGKLKGAYKDLIGFLITKTLEEDFRYIKLILTQRDYLGRFILILLFKIKSRFRCDAVKGQVCVSANGDVYPCDISIGIDDLKVGNVYDNQVVDPKIQKLYLDQCVTEKDSCSGCWARFICGGGCHYSNFLKNKNIETPDNLYCQLIKHLVELSVHFINHINKNNPKVSQQLMRYAILKEKIIDYK